MSAADELRRAVTKLARQLRYRRVEHGVSAGKLAVLGSLYRAGREMTAVDLARLGRLQPQSLTRIIADLEARGLLTRRSGETDRRQVLIRITEQGRALLAVDARLQNAWLDERLSGLALDAGAVETTVAVLNQIADEAMAG